MKCGLVPAAPAPRPWPDPPGDGQAGQFELGGDEPGWSSSVARTSRASTVTRRAVPATAPARLDAPAKAARHRAAHLAAGLLQGAQLASWRLFARSAIATVSSTCCAGARSERTEHGTVGEAGRHLGSPGAGPAGTDHAGAAEVAGQPLRSGRPASPAVRSAWPAARHARRIEHASAAPPTCHDHHQGGDQQHARSTTIGFQRAHPRVGCRAGAVRHPTRATRPPGSGDTTNSATNREWVYTPMSTNRGACCRPLGIIASSGTASHDRRVETHGPCPPAKRGQVLILNTNWSIQLKNGSNHR